MGTDYSIRGGRQNQTNIVNFVLLINQDISWASLQASFIITSRSDLLIGSFSPDTQSLFVSGADTLATQFQLANWTPVSGNVNFALLISGLRTADTFFNVNLTQANFNSQTGLMSIQVYTDANPSLEMIYISYMIILPSAPLTFVQYNPLFNTLVATFLFEGVDSISANTIIYEGYAMNFTEEAQFNIPCFGLNCPSNCVTSIRCSSLN